MKVSLDFRVTEGPAVKTLFAVMDGTFYYGPVSGRLPADSTEFELRERGYGGHDLV